MPAVDASVSELNLTFLHLVRESLLRNRLLALSEFQIDAQVADVLLGLSQDQLRRIADARVLLIALRWRRQKVWACLSDYAAGCANALPQALIAAEAEGNHGYQA